MSVQTITEEKHHSLCLRSEPKAGNGEDPVEPGHPETASGSAGTKALDRDSNHTENVPNNKHLRTNETLNTELKEICPTQPQSVQNSTVPSSVKCNSKQVQKNNNRRNKNAQPGKPKEPEISTPKRPTTLESQFSKLEIDGPEVPMSPIADISAENSTLLQSSGSNLSISSFTPSVSSTSLSSTVSQSDENADFNASPPLSGAASISRCSQAGCDVVGKRKDFVILSTEDDEPHGCQFMKHLKSPEVGIRDITVDMFSSVGIGGSEIKSLNSLPDLYNFILVYVTENLVNCHHTRFLNEILITYNLKNGLRNQVVPVWTKKSKFFEIPELYVIKGIEYWRFSDDTVKELYIECVRSLVQRGRSLNSP